MTDKAEKPDPDALKSIGKHFVVYSLSGILQKGIGFVMLPVYAHYLRGDGYGVIGMIDVVLSMLTLLLGIGIQSAMTRFYFEKKSETDQKILVSTAVISMFFLVTVVSLPALVFSKQIAWLAFGTEEFYNYIILTVLTFIASMTGACAQTFVLIQQRSILYSILALLRLFLGLFLNIYLIVYLELGVLGFLYSGLIVEVVFTIIFHIYTLFYVGLKFDKQDAIGILRFSFPLIPGYLADFVINNIDRVILRFYHGLTVVGTFSMLLKFSTLIGFLIVEPLSKISSVKCYEIADNPDGPITLAKFLTYQMALMLFVGLILCLEIPIILKLLTPEEFWLEGTVVLLAVLSRIILATYYHLSFGLFYAKKTIIVSYIQLGAAVVNIIVALVLIKPLGILGAVLATCFSNLFLCVLAHKTATLHYRIPFEWWQLGKLLIMFILLFYAIDAISLSKSDNISDWLTSALEKPLVFAIDLLNIESAKREELMTFGLTNLSLFLEGFIKLILSFSYLAGLVAVDIFPKKKLIAVMRNKSFAALFGDAENN